MTRFHRHQPLARLLAAVPGVMLLVACNGAANGSGPDAGAVKDVPPIHLDQTAELLVDGRNAQREGYLNAVNACEAGGLPTRRVAEADVALLGVTRYEVWIDGKSESTQTRTWKAVPESSQAPCQFHLEMTGTFTSTTQSRYLEQDLATGVSEEQPLQSGEELQRFALSAEDDAAPQGFQGPVTKQVAGQPCDEWTSRQNNRICVWSGGREWGFGSSRGDDVRPSSNSFVLEAEPADGNGYRMTTQTLSVGQAFAAPAAATEKL